MTNKNFENGKKEIELLNNNQKNIKLRRSKMKSLTQKILVVLVVLSGLFIQACKDQNTVVQPETAPTVQENSVSEEQLVEAIAAGISQSKENCGDAAIMHDLAIIAANDYSPESSSDFSDLIGLIADDSTIVYEGNNYRTVITYDIKYKVGNRIVEDYTPLADTALISYTVHATYNNAKFDAEREAYSVEFTVGGIKMPSTHFTVNLLSNFRMQVQYMFESYIVFYLNGQSYFNDLVINASDGTIESGTGGIQFTVSSHGYESDVIVVEIEFIGDSQAVIRVNGHEYTIDVDLGALLP